MLTLDETSKAIAASAYTRGLWSPIALLFRLSRPAFHGYSGTWGTDFRLIYSHANHATFLAVVWLLILVVVAVLFFTTGNPIFGILGIWLVLIQWNVYPWFMARRIFRRDSNPTDLDFRVPDVILTAGHDFTIPDLGYLVREAQFAIDTTKSTTGDLRKHDDAPIGAEEFLTELSSAFRDTIGPFCARLVRVRNSRSVQRESTAASAMSYSARDQGNPRLLIFAASEHAGHLNTAEVAAWNIGHHLSLLLRLRWLPPLSGGLVKLRYLANERFWWRGILLPIGLIGVASLLAWLPGLLWSVAQSWELVSRYDDLSGIMAIGVTLGFALVISLGFPLIQFGLKLMERVGHQLKGLVWSMAGKYFEIRYSESLRYAMSSSQLSDEEAIYYGVATARVIEDVLRNAAVVALKKRNIDPSQLQEQFTMFINEGLYVTGGTVRADQLAVGRRARARAKGQARRGHARPRAT